MFQVINMFLTGKKEGISLPVNLIVILSVSIIVLLSVVSFFIGVWRTDEIETDALRDACCTNYVLAMNGCDPESNVEDSWDVLDVDDDWPEEHKCGAIHQYGPRIECCGDDAVENGEGGIGGSPENEDPVAR